MRAIAEEVAAGTLDPDSVDEDDDRRATSTPRASRTPTSSSERAGRCASRTSCCGSSPTPRLWVTATLWPDFKRGDLLRAVIDYPEALAPVRWPLMSATTRATSASAPAPALLLGLVVLVARSSSAASSGLAAVDGRYRGPRRPPSSTRWCAGNGACRASSSGLIGRRGDAVRGRRLRARSGSPRSVGILVISAFFWHVMIRQIRLTDTGVTLFGAVYVGFTLAHLVLIRRARRRDVAGVRHDRRASG